MDFGQQRQQNQQNARAMMYQNTNYGFERRDKKTLIVDVADTTLISPLSKGEEFSVELFEPLIIDKLSDIYLDSFMTHNTIICHTGDTMAFALKINEFNVNSNAASTASNQHMFNSIIIPNDHSKITDVHSCVVHKGKKLNYVCSINPCRLSTISGKLTDLGGLGSGPEGSGDGGILHSVNIATGLLGDRAAGTAMTVASATTPAGGFKLAFYHSKDAETVFFYSTGSTIPTNHFNTPKGITVTGESSIDSVAKTYREGDYTRFIAEFVIVARE